MYRENFLILQFLPLTFPSTTRKFNNNSYPIFNLCVALLFYCLPLIALHRAHSLLFAAELPDYRARLPLFLQNEMLAFKKEEGIEKALKREAQKAKRKEKAEKGEEERATVIIEKTTEETIKDEILRTEERIVELEEEEGKVLRDVKTKAMSKRTKRQKVSISEEKNSCARTSMEAQGGGKHVKKEEKDS